MTTSWPTRLHGAPGDLDRRLARDDRQRGDAGLLPELPQLFLRGRTAGIERRHQDLLALALGKALRDLRRGRRLARALQADHHDDDRRGRVEVDRLAFLAEHLDKLVMDDLDDHLAGLDRLQHRGADGLLADLVGERSHDLERHVGLDERAADLAQRGRDVGLRQRAAAGEAVQDRAEAFLQRFEHSSSSFPIGENREVMPARPSSKQHAKPNGTRGRIALPDVGFRDRPALPFGGRRPGQRLGV